MARFRKRANNWQARIQRTGYPDLTKSFSTKADAIAWARHTETELDKGIFINTSEIEKTTLKELIPTIKNGQIKKRGIDKTGFQSP